MNLNPKRLFLIDAIGALISSFLLGIVLAYVQPLIGMPKIILYQLAIVALCLFAYSASCFLFVKKNIAKFLAVIALANYSYCIASFCLIIAYYPDLTNLGILYFIVEKVIVLTLSTVELKTALK